MLRLICIASVASALACVPCIAASPAATSKQVVSSTIDIGAALTNPLFSGTPGACPDGWTCGGSPDPGFSTYAPTSTQYTGGSMFATVAYSPTIFQGSGTIRQTTSLVWTAGQSYMLNLWVGLPLIEPDGTTPVVGFSQTARVYLVTDTGEQVAAWDLPAPVPGTFLATPLVFTVPNGSPFIGRPVGVLIFASSESYYSANFAIATSKSGATIAH